LVDDALDFLIFLVVLGQLGDKRVDVFSGLVVFEVLQLAKVAVIEDRVDLLLRFVVEQLFFYFLSEIFQFFV
jgi:hypothetical protein